MLTCLSGAAATPADHSTPDLTHLINWSQSSESSLVKPCALDWLEQKPAATRPFLKFGHAWPRHCPPHSALVWAVHNRQRFHLNSDSDSSELKDVAQLSGADFEKVLLDELVRIQESTKPKTTEPDASGIRHESQYVIPAHIADTTPTNIRDNQTHPHELDSPPLEVGAVVSSPPRNPTEHIPSEHLSTPEIQKEVFEHVIKNSDLPLYYHHSQVESPVPVQSLITTRGAATLSFSLQTLPCLPHIYTTRKRVESLLPPASSIKYLGPSASPHEHLAQLCLWYHRWRQWAFCKVLKHEPRLWS